MAPALLETTLLGLASGVSEVLPLSSDGHTALAHLLLGARLTTFDAWMVRVGAWLGVAAFFAREARPTLREAIRGLRRPSLLKETQPGGDAIVIGIATGATALVGFALRSQIGGWNSDPTLLGAGLFVSAVAVGSTLFAPRGDHDSPTPWGALMVGAAQGAAVLPGLSRTAVALTCLLWLGLRPQRAFELCFLIWLPAGLASLILDRPGACSDVELATLALATAVAGALVALFVLRGAVTRRALPAFSLYLVPVAFATTAWGYARP